MCLGKKDALSNTHKTITATYVVQTSSPTKTISLTLTTSSFTTRVTPSSSSTTVTRSSTGSLLTASSTLITSTLPSKTSDSSSQTSTQVLPDEAQNPSPTSTPSLSKQQIAGISAASVGGLAVIAGLIIFCTCWRRRRQRQRDSDVLPFQADPGTPKCGKRRPPLRGQSEFSKSKSSNGQSPYGTWTKLPPQVPPRLETSDPYMFSRRSIMPSTIGVAVSPDHDNDVPKRNSRLLPEKPTLKLNTSHVAELPAGASLLKPPLPIYAQMIRQSTATEFEEDEDSPAQETYGRGSTDRILPPPTPIQSTIRVIPPDDIPPAFFVTSNYPTNPNPEPPAIYSRPNNGPYQDSSKLATAPNYYVPPQNISRGVGSFSRPRPAPERSLQLQVPSRTTSQTANRHMIQGSSVYSGASNTPYTNAPSTDPLSSKPFPLTYPPPAKSDRRSQRRSYQQPGPYDRASTGSFTSFADSDIVSPDDDRDPAARGTIMMDLSPVIESPASGRSPVSYPRIPPRMSSQPTPTIRMVPPPPQPDFTSVFSSGASASRYIPSRDNSNARTDKPWQAAEIAAARQRRLSQAQAQATQRQAANPQPLLTPTKQPPPKLASPFQPRPSQGQAIRMNTGSPSQTHTRHRSRDYIAPSAHFNNKHLRNNSGSTSIASQNSTNSSLLAKRLGVEKAALLQLNAKAPEEKQQNKWRVLDQAEREAARDPGWRPQLSKFDGREREQRTEIRVRDVGREDGLPRTPGWVPKLTPTRRGDELFLSVA